MTRTMLNPREGFADWKKEYQMSCVVSLLERTLECHFSPFPTIYFSCSDQSGWDLGLGIESGAMKTPSVFIAVSTSSCSIGLSSSPKTRMTNW